MVEDTHPSYLSPSELGSKDYWETYYARTRAHLSKDKSNDATTTNPDTAAETNPDSDSDSETNNNINDEDDPGTSWFSEHNAPQKVLHFLTRRSFPLSPRNTRRDKHAGPEGGSLDPGRDQPSILDLGTGNGSMLALLRKRGRFSGRMVGVDYSVQSVQLARELQGSRGHLAYWSGSEDGDEDEEEEVEEVNGNEANEAASISPGQSESEEPIQFEVWDILSSNALLSPSGKKVTTSSESPDEILPWFPYEQGGFDIVLDKGTFDAISLADDAKETRVCQRYPGIVRRLLRAGGFLVVTSCNWTEEELVKWFTGGTSPSGAAGGMDRLSVWGRVEYPRFRFGGMEGQGVCTVCFQRVVG